MDIRDFLKADPKEREAEALKSMWGLVAKCVDEIARARKNAELAHGISGEEFDEKLNELCAKAHAKYCDMNKEAMALDMLQQLLKQVNPDDVEIEVIDGE